MTGTGRRGGGALLAAAVALVVALGATGGAGIGGAAPASQPTPTPTDTPEPRTPTASPTATPTPTPVSAALALDADAEVTVAGNGTGTGANGTETTTGTSGTAGATATVEVTLRNTGGNESVAPVVRVASLPDGWRVVGQSSETGTWRDSTREWLWLVVDPGETVSAELRLRADTPSSGEVELLAVDEADNRDATTVDLGPEPSPTEEGSGLAVFGEAAGAVETPSPLVLVLVLAALLAVGVLGWRLVRGGDGDGGGEE